MIEVIWLFGGMLFLLGAASQSMWLAGIGSALLVSAFWIATKS